MASRGNSVFWAVVFTLLLMTIVAEAREEAEEEEREEQEEEAMLSWIANDNLHKIDIQYPNLFPESFDWDANHTRFLVGSMKLGKIVSVDDEGVVEEFVKDVEYAGKAYVVGVKVDPLRNRVLAVVDSFSGPPFSALAAYDLDTKNRLLFVILTTNPKPGANDVAVDDEGNAYVTDCYKNSVYKVTPSGEKSALFDPLPQPPLMTEGAGIEPSLIAQHNTTSANGIVHSNGCLIISQTNSAALLRVGLADNEVTEVSVKDGTVGPLLDGLALRSDGSLVVISFHTAWLLTSKDSWQSASVREELTLEREVMTTSAAVKELRVYTLQSHLMELFSSGEQDNFKIQEIEFPESSDKNPLWLLVVLGIFAVLVLAWKFQMALFDKAYTKKRS